MIRIQVIILCIGLSFSTKGQVLHRSIEVGGLTGKMIDIYPNFPNRDLHKAIAINYSQYRASDANIRFGRPMAGLCISLHDFGNPTVLGYGIGLQYEMLFAQQLSTRLLLTERFRPGLIYNTAPFDHIDNPRNIVTGTHFAALIGASLGLRYQVTPRLYANLDFSMWHSSNGHTGLPNVGMNSPLGMLSLTWRFQQAPLTDSIQEIAINGHRSAWGVFVNAIYGINETGQTTRPVNGGLYEKYGASIGVGYRFRKIHRVSLSMDAYYDETYRLWNETQEWTTTQNFKKSSALMIMLGHEFIYNRWSLLIAGGVNLYNPTLGNIVNRIEGTKTTNVIKRYVPGRFAIRYYVMHPWVRESSMYVQAGIKSNFGQADFLEMGVGFILSKRRDRHDGCFGHQRKKSNGHQ